MQAEVRHLVGHDPPAHAEIEAPARELIQHADLFDQPERVVERQTVDARPETDAPRALGGRGQEEAGHRGQAERGHVMFGQMVGGEPRGVVFLEQPQPALVELVDGHVAMLEMVENAEVHRALLSGICQGYTPAGGFLDGDTVDASTGADPGGDRGGRDSHPRPSRAVLRADGVYAAIAATRYKVNCNAAVILTDDGVVVVDSHSKPSAARAVYKEIQAVTNKPIKKIINTHFHFDHWQGNEVYAGAGAEVIASQKTRENLTKPDAGVGGIPFIEKQIAALPKEIDDLKAEIQKASDPKIKATLESNLQQAESYLQEMKAMKPALPTRTVTTTLTLNERGREIQLHVPGRAHSDGALFIYLPKEKVVATGDAVIDWMPFMNDGYPEEWIGTIYALSKLE